MVASVVTSTPSGAEVLTQGRRHELRAQSREAVQRPSVTSPVSLTDPPLVSPASCGRSVGPRAVACTEEADVVPRREVLAHVTATGLLAQRGRIRQRAAEVEQVGRLPALRPALLVGVVGDGRGELVRACWVRASEVAERTVPEPAVMARWTSRRRFGRTQPGLPPAGRRARPRAAPPAARRAVRSSAMRRAKTRPSRRELLARRLAPCTPVHEVSPHA